MKRILLALACTGALAGCSAAPKTAAQTVFALQATYDAALDVAVAYATLPRCAPGAPAVCSDGAAVRRVNAAAHQAWAAIRAAQALARAAKPDVTALANARADAELALAVFTALTTQLKVT